MVLGSQQFWAKGPKASHVSMLLHMYLSHYRQPLQNGTFTTIKEPIIHIIAIQSPQFTLGFFLGVVYSMIL